MKFHLGAYAMSPTGQAWDETLEGQYIEGIRTLPFLRGLELPHYGALHRWDEDFFFRNADPTWDYVVSTLPAVSAALRESGSYGLASVDPTAREAALTTIRSAHASVRRTHDRLGRRAIQVVEVHSAPSGGRLDGSASTQAFAGSLAEVGSWDWDGATLVVEHCDAAIPGQA